MKLKYDLHIHSALSPCADNEMTPYNIVMLASMLEVDVLAITDHNSILNCAAAAKHAQDVGILFFPGLEINTAEEIHMVALFCVLTDAENFYKEFYETIPPIKNDIAAFGDQQIMNESDEVVSEEERLLINASALSIFEAIELVKKYNGYVFPAHIDRSSYSVISSLGAIPPECGFTALELAYPDNLEKWQGRIEDFESYEIIRNSDAHNLENLYSKEGYIELTEEVTKENFIKKLLNIK